MAASALGRSVRSERDGSDRPLPWSGGGAVGADPESLPVPESALRRAAARDAIPAIVDPAYGSDWNGVDRPPGLSPDDEVLGVVRDGRTAGDGSAPPTPLTGCTGRPG